MKKFLLLIVLLITTAQTIQSQTVVLDTNGVTVKWTGTTVPSPYFVQASPRGTLEWFAIVSDVTKSNILNIFDSFINKRIDAIEKALNKIKEEFDSILDSGKETQEKA